MNLSENPHKRYNVLTGEWILVSPHRMKRPWQGKVEKIVNEQMPDYDEKCYLCPGNTRAGGENNPEYKTTYVFTNDYSALLQNTGTESDSEKDLLVYEGESGICRVICFSPRHNLTLALMQKEDIKNVIDVWCEEFISLSQNSGINYVQIFENRGAVMGCSNPHPHGQIWANHTVPYFPALETEKQKEYKQRKGKCLLCDYLTLEKNKRIRIVFENETFIVLVPFWAVWPYEVMVLPKKHFSAIIELNESEKFDLADCLKRTGIRYDNLFSTSFPYSMGIHQKPTDGLEHDEWHFHLHYYPPLLRSATVKKFMVGYEMLAMPQRDITAEASAEKLRNLTEKHY